MSEYDDQRLREWWLRHPRIGIQRRPEPRWLQTPGQAQAARATAEEKRQRKRRAHLRLIQGGRP